MRVKICGITNREDALLAVKLNTDAIGLVFYGASPRNVANLDVAREIALAVGPFVTVVGLVVNPELDFMGELLNRVPLHVLQFHGDENAAFCEQFDRPYIKAVRMKEGVDVLEQMGQFPGASGFLLDAYKKGVPGGTGECFDWARVPRDPPKPLVLAGGLSPANVASAIKSVKPYGIDVSGGVEASPGKKDKAKIEAFIENAKVE
ncbi:phosphoribosylanthranilate isomerase [Teredinibacter haidensis]|uniref:phosphoribosylanthranilate isomerase n=1 Tax=Teredinibacter haidensis TaxID=2731755 RepID=UPI000948A65C|nr:phosphoribosylanthranilate isomerase [Teredinibacter haidensis]